MWQLLVLYSTVIRVRGRFQTPPLNLLALASYIEAVQLINRSLCRGVIIKVRECFDKFSDFSPAQRTLQSALTAQPVPYLSSPWTKKRLKLCRRGSANTLAIKASPLTTPKGNTNSILLMNLRISKIAGSTGERAYGKKSVKLQNPLHS